MEILKIIYHKNPEVSADISKELIPLYKAKAFQFLNAPDIEPKNLTIYYRDSDKDCSIDINVSHITDEYISNYIKTLDHVSDDEPDWAEYFKNIWCISSHPKETLKNIVAIEKHKRINIRMFDAICPTEHNPIFPTIGQQGCSYSHYSVVKMARENDWDNVMILEDDLVVHKYFNRYMNDAVEDLKKIDWNIFYAHHNKSAYVPFRVLTEYEHTQRVTSTSYMHCWCFNKSMYDKFINTFEDIIFNRRKIGHVNNQIYQLSSATIQVTTKENLTTQLPRRSQLSHNMAIVKNSEIFI